MKKILFLLLLIIGLTVLFADDFSLSGTNDLELVYKTAEDSLNTYFYNELSLLANYNRLVFGMKFLAEMPRYYSDHPIDELNPRDVEVKWDERYLTYEGDKMTLHLGTTEEFIGSGMLFRAYRDDDVSVDTRLEAALIKAETDYFRIKSLYGGYDADDYPDKYNLAGLFDIETLVIPHTKLGATYVQNQALISNSEYDLLEIYGARLIQEWDYFDIYGEYGKSYTDKSDIEGDGYYANLNAYLGEFTFTGAYKRYLNFKYDLNDVPTVNYHEETLADDVSNGEDEEGFMGEISWEHNDYSAFVSYSEAWDTHKIRQMNDFFGSFGKSFGENIVTAECGYWEKVNDDLVTWHREITPTLVFDIPTDLFGYHIKTEMQRIEKEYQGVEVNHWEPLLQTDISFENYSLSIITETNVEDFADIMDSQFFVNAEFRTTIYENTDVVLFGGTEKGGKVCRNGVCKINKPFEGVRLELSTRF
jgi:hypothetical protein